MKDNKEMNPSSPFNDYICGFMRYNVPSFAGLPFMLFFKWAGLEHSIVTVNAFFFPSFLRRGRDGDYRADWNLSVDVGEKKGWTVTRLLHHMAENMCAKQGEAGGREGQEPSCLCIDQHRCAIWYHDDPSFPAESIYFQSSWQWPSYPRND